MPWQSALKRPIRKEKGNTNAENILIISPYLEEQNAKNNTISRKSFKISHQEKLEFVTTYSQL